MADLYTAYYEIKELESELQRNGWEVEDDLSASINLAIVECARISKKALQDVYDQLDQHHLLIAHYHASGFDENGDIISDEAELLKAGAVYDRITRAIAVLNRLIP